MTGGAWRAVPQSPANRVGLWSARCPRCPSIRNGKQYVNQNYIVGNKRIRVFVCTRASQSVCVNTVSQANALRTFTPLDARNPVHKQY